jgi:hypothetical protein
VYGRSVVLIDLAVSNSEKLNYKRKEKMKKFLILLLLFSTFAATEARALSTCSCTISCSDGSNCNASDGNTCLCYCATQEEPKASCAGGLAANPTGGTLDLQSLPKKSTLPKNINKN